MDAVTGRFRILTAALALLAGAATPDAHAQSGIYELRCRGAEGLYAIDGPDVTGSDTVHINFSQNQRSAAADGAGLEPGACGWLDRAFRDGEPSQLHVRPGASLASLEAQLADSNGYWGFWVTNTNEGFFRASRHEQRGAPRSPPGQGVRETPGVAGAVTPVPDPADTQVASAVALAEQPLPPRAAAIQASVAPRMQPSVRAWVQSEARALLARNLGPDAMIAAVRRDVRARFAGQDIADMDVERLVTLVLVQASTDARSDLRALGESRGASPRLPNTAGTSAAELDMIGLQQLQSQRQMAIERMNNLQRGLLKTLTQRSDTSGSFLDNLK